MKGYVYILSNQHMLGLVKIGKTTRDVESRANELWQTGVPSEFKIEGQYLSPDCDALEAMVHRSLANNRISPAREFFEVPVRVADKAVADCHREQLEEWLDEFLPDQVIVDEDNFVDTGAFKKSFYKEVHESGLCPPEVAEALYQIEGPEFRGAIKRQQAISKLRRDDYERSKSDRAT